MQKLLSLRGEFTTQAGSLFIITGAGYVFGYLYLVFMGRFLGPEVFGILGSLFAIFYIACLVGQALRGAIARNVAEIKARAGESAAVSAYLKLGLKLGLLYLLFPLLFIVASQQIASFFHLTSIGPVIILGFSLLSVLILDIVLGLMQGLQKFRELGISGYLVSQGLKFLFGVVFVWVGWDLMGAVGALLASTAIGIVLGLVFLRRQLASGARSQAWGNPKLAPLLAPAIILAVFMSIPTSVDVMLVTHFLGGKEAGLYNAIATLGKVVIFLPMAVSFVLLPKATENHTLGLGSRNILLQGLLYASVLSGAVTLAYWIFPHIIVKLFFGEVYLEATSLLARYGTAMFLFSLNFVLIHYSLAIRNLRLMLLADFITLAEVVAIILLHHSLSQVIWILLFGNLLIFLCSLSSLVVPKRVRGYTYSFES
jgi:O-antigen/teichoic acid export membrane protein